MCCSVSCSRLPCPALYWGSQDRSGSRCARPDVLFCPRTSWHTGRRTFFCLVSAWYNPGLWAGLWADRTPRTTRVEWPWAFLPMPCAHAFRRSCNMQCTAHKALPRLLPSLLTPRTNLNNCLGLVSPVQWTHWALSGYILDSAPPAERGIYGTWHRHVTTDTNRIHSPAWLWCAAYIGKSDISLGQSVCCLA